MSPTGNEVKQTSTQFSNIRKYPKEYLGFLTTQGYLRQKATNPRSKGKTRAILLSCSGSRALREPETKYGVKQMSGASLYPAVLPGRNEELTGPVSKNTANTDFSSW